MASTVVSNAALALLCILPFASAARTEVLFNDAWLFYQGNLPWTCSSPESAAVFPINTSSTAIHNLVDTPAGAASASACAAQCASDCGCQAWQWCGELLGETTCGSATIHAPNCSDPISAFPTVLDGIQCSGLEGVSAHSEEECAAACCGEAACGIYQWCPAQGHLGDGSVCGPTGSCWIGQLTPGACKPEEGWASRARNVTLGPACQIGLLADYGPGNWQTSDADAWVGAARLAPPAPPAQVDGPASVGFDDSRWEQLTLPHDYLARVAPTDVNASAHQNEHGSIPFSNAWYRKHFTIPAGTVAARLYFDGAYRSASIFLNGALAAQHEEGYTGFSVWLHNVSGTPLLVGGGENVLAIYLAATIYTFELWGYEGEGIQRDVSLILHDSPVSIAPWGVFARSEVSGEVLAPSGADGPLTADSTVLPSVDVANGGNFAVTLTLVTTAVAPDGTEAGSSATQATLLPGGWARLSPFPPIILPAAQLWSPANSPTAPPRPLYTLVTLILDATTGAVLDAVNTTFGIRNVHFDPSSGLTVNGFPHKLRGLSIHENFGSTGTFVPPRIQQYRMQRVLDIGANAWRCAHNPVDSHVLDAADARGVMVWEEARFLRDADVYVRDAGDMVARDRNHPSIILWSLCNENGCGEQPGWEGAPAGEQAGFLLATRFMAHLKTLDDSRPITANAHNTLGANGSIFTALDVMGLTYDQGSLDSIHAARPKTPLLNGESASCQSDRADRDASGVIGCSRDSWAPPDARVWDSGAFAWSGFDYRGETSWPAVISFYGVLDYCGFAKPVSHWYTVWWGAAAGWPDAPTRVLASPPWVSPPGGGGVKITAIATAATLALDVNGVLHGVPQAVSHLGFAEWDDIPFAEGNYTITSFDSAGTPLGSFTSVTPGAPIALRAAVDWGGSGAGGSVLAGHRDAALVTVSVVDARGVVVGGGNGAGVNVTFTVEGNGELLGLCNGDHTNHLPGVGGGGVWGGATAWTPTYDGLARAVVRAGPVGGGESMRVSVTAAGLVGDSVEVGVE